MAASQRSWLTRKSDTIWHYDRNRWSTHASALTVDEDNSKFSSMDWMDRGRSSASSWSCMSWPLQSKRQFLECAASITVQSCILPIANIFSTVIPKIFIKTVMWKICFWAVRQSKGRVCIKKQKRHHPAYIQCIWFHIEILAKIRGVSSWFPIFAQHKSRVTYPATDT